MNMDFVDLDKVLDDFEEDEERVCMPGQELKPSGYAQYVKENSENYNVSISQKVSDVPFPHQVSNDFSPLDSTEKFSVVGMYDVPFELTEKIDLSEADFGPSLRKDNSLESSDSTCISPTKGKLNLQEEFTDRSDIINDHSDLGQFMTENGIFRINVLQNNSENGTTLRLGQVGGAPVNHVDKIGHYNHLDSGLSEGRFNSIHTVNGVVEHSVGNQLDLENTKPVPSSWSYDQTGMHVSPDSAIHGQNILDDTHDVMSSGNSRFKSENSEFRVACDQDAVFSSTSAPCASDIHVQNGFTTSTYTGDSAVDSTVRDDPMVHGQSSYSDGFSPVRGTNSFKNSYENNIGHSGSDPSPENPEISSQPDSWNIQGARSCENDYVKDTTNTMNTGNDIDNAICDGELQQVVGFGEGADDMSDTEVMEYLEGDGDVTQCLSESSDKIAQGDQAFTEPTGVNHVIAPTDMLLLHKRTDGTAELASGNSAGHTGVNLPEVVCNTGTYGEHLSNFVSSSRPMASASTFVPNQPDSENNSDANSQDISLSAPIIPTLHGGVSSPVGVHVSSEDPVSLGDYASLGSGASLEGSVSSAGAVSSGDGASLGGGVSSGMSGGGLSISGVSVSAAESSNPDVCPGSTLRIGGLGSTECRDGNGGSNTGRGDFLVQMTTSDYNSLASSSGASSVSDLPASINSLRPDQVHDGTILQSADGCPGVKPKDLTRLKRPTSLLGLSTVSLQTPFNMPKSQSLPRSFAVSESDTVASPSATDMTKRDSSMPAAGSDSRPVDNFPMGSARTANNADLDETHEGGLSVINGPTGTGNHGNRILPSDIAVLDGDVLNVQILQDSTCDGDAVLMRDKELSDHAMQVSSLLPPIGDPQPGRPHSWGPQGTQPSDTTSKQKRPNSLNLPPRREFPPPSLDKSSPTRGASLDDTDSGGEASCADVIDHPASHMQYIPEEGETSAGALYTEEGAVGGVGVHPYQTYPTDPHNSLGGTAPVWLPDSDAPKCMQCEARFTFTKRRHHCRACGKVFCSSCCSLKCKLRYMGAKEGRVCSACHHIISIAQSRSGTVDRSPNPNNPSEYCSTIPPHQQANAHTPAPTVMVPVGVLKREGSHRKGEPKQVMFSDGIRPGGDLTETEGVSQARLPVRSGRKVQKIDRGPGGAEGPQSSPRSRHLKANDTSRYTCLVPAVGLPPVVLSTGIKGDFSVDDNPTDERVMQQIQSEDADPVVFMINRNLYCLVTIVNLDCCVNRRCWCFTSRGMCTVGQDEMVVVLECLPDEHTVPMDIFHHYQTVYEEASKGNTVTDMGHSIFNQSFLGSKDHGGFLYIRPTFQCMQKLVLPGPTYVFGILLQKWETPWAKVFPIRLLLRLGAEYRYYPCPLISIRNRKPVFFEIGHTIMNLLADFRSFQYMLPQVRGVVIHMEDKRTVINFPRNRYDDLMKVVNSSNEHVMALGANFSTEADSHLVCIQNDDGNYQTQAINIQNKPRKVTGASFVVFNGALKTTSGLTAKSSIVEDGLMVQISPESMSALKQAIKDMKNYNIGCGSAAAAKPEEIVILQWVDDDKSVNVGVKSPVDKMALDGIESVHIHNGTDYLGDNKIIRWTEVFFIQSEDSGSAKWEPIDLSRLAETLARAGCVALTPHLDKLKEASLTKLGLRATIDSESVGYEVGSNGDKLPDFYMNDLDNELIPVIHNAASQNQEGPIILELIFHILD